MKNRYYTKKALHFAIDLRKNQTDAENILWFNIRNRKLNDIKFKRQVPIGKYIVDFVNMQKKLVIELDGSQHIDNSSYDEEHTRYLNSIGYTVIRFFDNDVIKNINTVLEVILKKYSEL